MLLLLRRECYSRADGLLCASAMQPVAGRLLRQLRNLDAGDYNRDGI
jgi:hypothetical protein